MVKVTGGGGFSTKLSRFASAEAKQRVGAALFAAGQLIDAEAARLITTGSQGGKNHVPSAPGEPPNNNTGVLVGNIETVQVQQLKVEVSSNAPYAATLEFGTSKMQARPYMGPATLLKKEEAVALVARAIGEVTR